MAYIYDDNGNYKKTVRCSYCYQAGHSSRTCPDKYPNGTPAQQRHQAQGRASSDKHQQRQWHTTKHFAWAWITLQFALRRGSHFTWAWIALRLGVDRTLLGRGSHFAWAWIALHLDMDRASLGRASHFAQA